MHKMFNRFGFLFLISAVCFYAEGAVFSAFNWTNMTFTPGNTGRIVWSFTDDIKHFSYRIWIFTPSDGRHHVNLAVIQGDGDIQILTTSYEVAVEKPATLVLKNVNLTYDGTYRFSLSPDAGASDVFVYIAVKPNATACSSPITVNEGDNVSCACQGQGGNPPADVTWYKNNHKISGTGKEEKTLILTNVTNEKDHGNYKCVAQSYPSEMFQDEVIVEVIFNYKPNKTKIEVPEEAYVGEKLIINCSSQGLPAPNFTITHNVPTNIVSNHLRYAKDRVVRSDAGLYECIAKNELGSDRQSGKLIVKDKRPSTKSAPHKPTTQSKPGKTTDNGGGISSGAIAGICVVVLLLVTVTIVVYCWYKKKEKNRRNILEIAGNRRNIDQPIGGNHYELDNDEPVERDNAYDTLVPVASASKSNASEKDTLPPVYAAVDKNNRQGNTLYTSVDTDALRPKRESKKRPADRAPQTDYASIDFARTAANATKDDPA